ncbi:MAG: hypothetical protein NC084_06245 [Bacteroides sp.]|nr:hypothetical protein [Eubacterium sp.]MCM1418174.1 hypothetical protein [Roseburia sp.]MCM1462301.1 hypothetical protein [Bacteroides sp.]
MADYSIAELAQNVNMYELAFKTNRGMTLTAEEDKARDNLDQYFKEVGARGRDKEHQVADFMQEVVHEELYNTPDELLDVMFDQGDVGEFDDYEGYTEPKNTLVAYEAAKGGNVERSFLDPSFLKPTWKNRQIETDISFAELERGGWKSVSKYTEYATAAFKNARFQDIFAIIDAAMAPGAENVITVASSFPTQVAVDQAALYIQDRADDKGIFIGRSKYIQAISKLPGFISQDMMNEINRTGRLGTYDGVSLIPISSAKKLGDGSGLIMDKRIFGIAGKIGRLNTKGSIKTYQVEDPNKEKMHIMFKNFTYGFSFNKDTLENIVKITLE